MTKLKSTNEMKSNR